MRGLGFVILVLIPFFVFSQDRVRFKYFDNTEEYKRGEYEGIVKGVEFYDTAGRMTSEYDFTKIEPLDRIYKLGLESNWIEKIHFFSKDDCTGEYNYSKKDSLFWLPFIADKAFSKYILCSIECFYPKVIFRNDTLAYLYFSPTFYYQPEGGTSFSGFLYRIGANTGIMRINPTNFIGVHEFSKDGNWVLAYTSDPEINVLMNDEIKPKKMLINCLTNQVEFTINDFSYATTAVVNNFNFYLQLSSIAYYIKPKERCYTKFDLGNLFDIRIGTYIDKETVIYRNSNNEIVKKIDLRSIKNCIKY